MLVIPASPVDHMEIFMNELDRYRNCDPRSILAPHFRHVREVMARPYPRTDPCDQWLVGHAEDEVAQAATEFIGYKTLCATMDPLPGDGWLVHSDFNLRSGNGYIAYVSPYGWILRVKPSVTDDGLAFPDDKESAMRQLLPEPIHPDRLDCYAKAALARCQ